MKKILKITTLSLVATSAIYASGYKIPETSASSVALGGANVAHVKGADAAYDNPANMVFMDDTNYAEVDVMYVGTSATNFQGTVGTDTTVHNINAEEQTFIIPSVHYVSGKLGDSNARVGLSIVVPGGLTREWKAQPAQSVAEEFTLQVVEINPTAAFEVTKELSVAAGFRIVHSSGVVKSSGAISRDMQGDSNDFGYNLALSYKPMKALDIALTYRSNVELSEEGNAKLSIGNSKVYDGGSSVSVPLPAAFVAAIAYTLPTDTTLEFVYEKTYWSAYKSLDFSYASSISNVLVPYFDTPIPKNWNDTEAYRIGLTQELDALTLMAGFVIDKTPIPEETLNFESPGSDAMSVSLGARYKISKTIDVGLSALYSMKEDRTISNTTNINGINGTFTDSNALLISAGLGYRF